MADTSAQVEIAEWTCKHVLPDRFGAPFFRQRVPLSCGGTHSFAAVSIDDRIVGSICTGSAGTIGGRLAVGKLNKVRSDLYFLLLAKADRRFLAITQPVMFQLLKAEQELYRRIPATVELIQIDLPKNLRERLRAAQSVAAAEVSPA